MPTVWNSVSLNLLEPSWPVTDLYREWFTFLFHHIDNRLWVRCADDSTPVCQIFKLLEPSWPITDLYREWFTFLFRPIDNRLWVRCADDSTPVCQMCRRQHTGVPDLRLCYRAASVMSCIDWEPAALSYWHHWSHSSLGLPFSMLLYLSDPLVSSLWSPAFRRTPSSLLANRCFKRDCSLYRPVMAGEAPK